MRRIRDPQGMMVLLNSTRIGYDCVGKGPELRVLRRKEGKQGRLCLASLASDDYSGLRGEEGGLGPTSVSTPSVLVHDAHLLKPRGYYCIKKHRK